MYLVISSVFFFFFKQKTAYEMRISDWSSDVCSSDLSAGGGGSSRPGRAPRDGAAGRRPAGDPVATGRACRDDRAGGDQLRRHPRTRAAGPLMALAVLGRPGLKPADAAWVARSEEHTSELQSLMRISYAVFCLKKKHNITHTQHTQ